MARLENGRGGEGKPPMDGQSKQCAPSRFDSIRSNTAREQAVWHDGLLLLASGLAVLVAVGALLLVRPIADHVITDDHTTTIAGTSLAQEQPGGKKSSHDRDHPERSPR